VELHVLRRIQPLGGEERHRRRRGDRHPAVTPNHSAASTVGSTSRNVAPMYVGSSSTKRTPNNTTKRPITMAARRVFVSRIPASSLVT
jgi:hypothetical protein